MRERILRIFIVSLLLVVPFLIWLAPEVMAFIFTAIVAVAPIWLPLILAIVLAPLWLLYARSQYVSSIPYTIIELKPGDSTTRPAHAMEMIFYSLYHRTDISRVMAILVGQVRLPWSFEIAASGGTVRFFIRMPKAHQEAVEARLRSEYRDIDISPARDYAREVSTQGMRISVREYALAKADPYPLKTYESYASDNKSVDPFSLLLDDLIKTGEGEHLFLSFMVRPHQRERARVWDEEESDTLHEDATHEIAKLTGASGNPDTLPEPKKRIVKAIEEALRKPSFDVGARALYLATDAAYRDERAQSLDTLLGYFTDPDLNSFTAYNPSERFTWPLSDVVRAVPAFTEPYLLHLYRMRAYFAPPYYGQSFVLNTAELATVWHLPRVTRTSPLARARGSRLEPPDNLPVAA